MKKGGGEEGVVFSAGFAPCPESMHDSIMFMLRLKIGLLLASICL